MVKEVFFFFFFFPVLIYENCLEINIIIKKKNWNSSNFKSKGISPSTKNSFSCIVVDYREDIFACM